MSVDPLTLAGRADATSVLAAELPHKPVWLAEPGVVHIVGYRPCRAALLDHDRFSADATRHGPTGLGGVAAPPRTMNATDPPEQDRLRSVAAAPFTRKAVAARTAEVDAVAGQLLDPLVADGGFHVVKDFAGPFVQRVLGMTLGLPPGHEHDIQRWSDAITAPTGRRDVERARRELMSLFAELVDRTDDLPASSLLRHFRAAEADGRLSREELLATCALLVVAGSETTRNLLALTLLTLAEQPGLVRTVRDNPELRPSVVEEALRVHSSVAAAVRYTTGPTTVADTALPGGCPVFVWIGAANRDPSEFPNPDAFDLTRSHQHLAFGAGPHVCLGAHLARAEISAALVALVNRIERLDVDGPIKWLPSPLARGPLHATVVCTPRDDGVRRA